MSRYQVTGNRVQGSEGRRLRLFEKILGEDAYSHVIIATTMWSELHSSVDGASRVSERMFGFWGDLIKHGARVVKHDNTSKSATDIVGMLVKKSTVTLRMQAELESNEGLIMGSAAGRHLYADLGDDSKKLYERIEKLEKELQEDRAKRNQLAEELAEQQAEYESLQQQQSQLKQKRVSYSVLIFWRWIEHVFIKVPRSVTTPAWLSALSAVTRTASSLGLCNIL